MAKLVLRQWGIRIGLLIRSWIVGGAVFGVIAATLYGGESERFQQVVSAYVILGTWVCYRLGARILRLPPPRGVMCTFINLFWCLQTFAFVGGAEEALVGRPNLGAGFSGIVAAVLLYLLLAQHTKDRYPRKSVSATIESGGRVDEPKNEAP